jgi:fatty acid desaturase
LKTGYYSAYTRNLRQELADYLDRQRLRELHQRRPVKHFAVLIRQLLLLGAGAAGVYYLRNSGLWIFFSALLGLTIFNFTVLLHEVLHGLVFAGNRQLLTRMLEFAYALPSGISPSQFTRWHLDHHAELGSGEGDPKRRYLSPRINRPWYKLLYFTPALFPIYFRAAERESRSYPAELRRLIKIERFAAIALHLSIALALAWLGGPGLMLKAHVVPVFVFFPVAFALNRLGQHYDICPEDPARWSTLMRPSRFWDFAYLWSNYHLEHHYYPGVPFYNLPRLRSLLEPWIRARGMRARSYRELLYDYLILNRKPHTNWAAADAEASLAKSSLVR